MPDWPAAEERLIETHFPLLLHDLDTEQGRNFLAVYATLISGVRPSWVVRLKGAARDGTRRCAPNTGLIAVPPEAARWHCQRGARGTKRSNLT